MLCPSAFVSQTVHVIMQCILEMSSLALVTTHVQESKNKANHTHLKSLVQQSIVSLFSSGSNCTVPFYESSGVCVETCPANQFGNHTTGQCEPCKCII